MLSAIINFFVLLVKSLISRKYVNSKCLDYLNAAEILYIHSKEDHRTGFRYMYINFASHHKLCVMFYTKEEYDEAIKQLGITN